jgi:hypothetical protein
MPRRLFASETWSSDKWFVELNRDQKYLFIYLWTNDHVNQAGVYQIPLRTMSFETGFDEDELSVLLPMLSPKAEWYPDESYVWVRNFIKHQAMSPKFLTAAARCLREIKNNGLIKEVIDYNRERYRISIPYEYPIDRVSILTVPVPVPDSVPDTDTEKGRREGKPSKPKTPKVQKRTFGELMNVTLTPEEYDKLVVRFGAQGATSWIDELSLAKASKGYKSKSDYATILAWERRKTREKGGASGVDKRVIREQTQERLRPLKYIRGSEEPGAEGSENMS